MARVLGGRPIIHLQYVPFWFILTKLENCAGLASTGSVSIPNCMDIPRQRIIILFSVRCEVILHLRPNQFVDSHSQRLPTSGLKDITTPGDYREQLFLKFEFGLS